MGGSLSCVVCKRSKTVDTKYLCPQLQGFQGGIQTLDANPSVLICKPKLPCGLVWERGWEGLGQTGNWWFENLANKHIKVGSVHIPRRSFGIRWMNLAESWDNGISANIFANGYWIGRYTYIYICVYTAPPKKADIWSTFYGYHHCGAPRVLTKCRFLIFLSFSLSLSLSLSLSISLSLSLSRVVHSSKCSFRNIPLFTNFLGHFGTFRE